MICRYMARLYISRKVPTGNHLLMLVGPLIIPSSVCLSVRPFVSPFVRLFVRHTNSTKTFQWVFLSCCVVVGMDYSTYLIGEKEDKQEIEVDFYVFWPWKNIFSTIFWFFSLLYCVLMILTIWCKHHFRQYLGLHMNNTLFIYYITSTKHPSRLV